MLLGACKKILSCSSKTCNEAVWGDLGVEPLALRRAKSKVVWYSKLLGKDKIVTVDRFLIRNGVNVNYEVEGGSSGKNV